MCGPSCVTTGCSAGQPASRRGRTNPISCNGVKGHCSLLQNCCGQLPEQELKSTHASLTLPAPAVYPDNEKRTHVCAFVLACPREIWRASRVEDFYARRLVRVHRCEMYNQELLMLLADKNGVYFIELSAAVISES